MVSSLPAYVEPIVTGAQPLILLALAGGSWLALQRTSMPPRERVRVWAFIAVPLLLWLAVAWLLSVLGTFEPRANVYLPAIPWPIALPIIAGLYLLPRSQRVAEALDATPPAWLVGVQFYRVLGGIFLILFVQGLLPGEFALPAGIGDVFVGVSGLALAFWLPSGTGLSRKAAYAWNILGIADLIVAVATGFLTSPGPLQALAFDRPNLLITAYPLVLIPAFAVPLSILLHVLSIWQLNRQGRGAVQSGRGLGAARLVHS